MVLVAVLATVAHAVRVPYPILLVFGGLVLAALPAVPNIQLAPELVFLFFLPPLLYIAGFETSLRDVKAQLRDILSLAIGLVLVTIVAVAVVTNQLLPELGWAAAFALGAIVSPPDAVAAQALLGGLGVPRRLVTLLDGESLFNDATALVAYQAALLAAATATFSPSQVVLQFVVAAVGGVLVGVAVGAGIAWLRRRLDDPPVEITVSLLTPFAAYLPAEQLGFSGVLATVTAGLFIGWFAPRIMESDTRLRGRAVWDMLVFMLNSLVFILIGLQLSGVVDGLSARPLSEVIGFGALISLTVIVVRLAWIFGATYVSWWTHRLIHGTHELPFPNWRRTFVVGWAGMRGVVTLATALALPLAMPGRDILIFVAFCVILATLVGQGLTLPLVIRALGIGGDSSAEADEQRARTIAAEAAVARIEELADEWPGHLPLIDTLRSQYTHRASHLGTNGQNADGAGSSDPSESEQELLEHRQIRRAVIEAEREAVLRLRTAGALPEEAWRRVERDLDLEELRMEA